MGIVKKWSEMFRINVPDICEEFGCLVNFHGGFLFYNRKFDFGLFLLFSDKLSSSLSSKSLLSFVYISLFTNFIALNFT